MSGFTSKADRESGESWEMRAVAGALRQAIEAHGPVTRLLAHSAAKRIVGQLAKGDRPADWEMPAEQKAARYDRAQGLAGADPLEQITEIAELCGQHDPEQSTLAESVKDRLDGKDEALSLAEKQSEESQYELCTHRDVLLSLVQRLLAETDEYGLYVIRGPLREEARAKVAEVAELGTEGDSGG